MAETSMEPSGVQTWSERLLKGIALLGGVVLFAVMCLVSIAVFYRYVLNQPILGDAEIVQIGMSLIVMLAIPYTTLTGKHIRVDILDHRIGAIGRFMGDIFARAVGAYVLFLLIGKTWQKTLDAIEYEDVTNMLEIPVWIAYGAITLGMGLYVLVLIAQLISQFSRGVTDYE